MKYPRDLDRDELTGSLRGATEAELRALAELGEWMTQHHVVLTTGRANGIRIGTTQEVAQFMLDSLDPDVAGTVAGNLVPLPNMIIRTQKVVGVDAKQLGNRYEHVLGSALRADPDVLVICNPVAGDFDFAFARTAYESGHCVQIIPARDFAPQSTEWLTHRIA
jgi:hypothetical protein